MEVAYHPLVKQDVSEALKYYAEISSRLADEVLAVIQDHGSKPFTAKEIARRFNRAQTTQVTEILETLCAVGKARKTKNANTHTSSNRVSAHGSL